ncbi:MAG TPA: sensor histidine kinase [Gemmatimonadaceae bacterium]|nr:sensor histidine kinase [Gemmatimonadaceae bacterium]
MRPIQRKPSRGSGRIAVAAASRAVRVLAAVLGIPLEIKLLGANAIILGVAVLALLEPIRLRSGQLMDVYVVAAALIIGAMVNFALVKLALSPIAALQRVARLVSEGRLAERVPASIVADRELTSLSTTINEMLDSLSAGRDRMRKLGAEVVYAEERERSQVARELHDSVGQTLAAASFQVAAVAHEIGTHPASARLVTVRELLRTALEEIRNVSRSLHPRVASDLGLPAALEALGDATQHRSLVDVRVNVDISGVVIPLGLSATLYRVAQEALRNVERHADAGHATVSLRARAGYVELEINDDGRGLPGPLEKKRAETALSVIRERLSLAGGELHIDNAADRGTRVIAWVGMDTEAA